jgi:dTDP-4-amino-4,6-dideoxygalactose transaminase
MDTAQVEALVTERTRVIAPVHYAGVSVDMDPILALAKEHGIRVVEDAAQAVEATYKGRQLGTLGDLAAFSFHETKNIHCGEGGMIAVNDPALVPRSEILREKGTNRSAFSRGEVEKYAWMDVGSSFLPSDILAAILWTQLETLRAICDRRLAIWNRYHAALAPLEEKGVATVPRIPSYAGHNAHIFYLNLPDELTRTRLSAHLKAHDILAVFHYQSLHRSPFFTDRHDGRPLPNSDRFSDCLLRLPLFHDLSFEEQDRVIGAVGSFFGVWRA